MWFTCDLDICGESVEFEVLMCDGEIDTLITKERNWTDISEILILPCVVKGVMKAYNDYIGG
jgi:hypothetical protein